ncbi:MAG TPA: hypothetical protein DIW15_00225 [Bavariicoccus seileri]|uniref:Uncharacterized protein n=1 Tax=Bavariicoccus seileri TaxID=549685 RepID=A0A3D4S590_9ENTE|nr:hypothetical protein [Bavariicoccus seileri]HCS93121.1 hypothetical protein [Bavariicoccus seileri]
MREALKYIDEQIKETNTAIAAVYLANKFFDIKKDDEAIKKASLKVEALKEVRLKILEDIAYNSEYEEVTML